MRFTPPRAGSFMYHSHSNESGQISAGVYGPQTLVNGRLEPAPIDVPADVPVRLRIIGIRTETSMDIGLYDGEAPVTWRLVGKDGFALPAAKQRVRPAVANLSPGEIMDVEVVVPKGKVLRLQHALADTPAKDARVTRWELRGR